MGNGSYKVTVGTGRIESLKVMRVADPARGVELQAYARLSFRPRGAKHDLTIMFFPHDPDTVRFLLDMMEQRHTLYMEIKGIDSPIPFFDTLARKLGFRTYWIGPWDIVQMNLGDSPIRFPL